MNSRCCQALILLVVLLVLRFGQGRGSRKQTFGLYADILDAGRFPESPIRSINQSNQAEKIVVSQWLLIQANMKDVFDCLAWLGTSCVCLLCSLEANFTAYIIGSVAEEMDGTEMQSSDAISEGALC